MLIIKSLGDSVNSKDTLNNEKGAGLSLTLAQQRQAISVSGNSRGVDDGCCCGGGVADCSVGAAAGALCGRMSSSSLVGGTLALCLLIASLSMSAGFCSASSLAHSLPTFTCLPL